MLIFTKFKSSLFQGPDKYPANTGDWNNINVHVVSRQDSETALNQRSFYPLCLQGICLETYLENIRNEVQRK